MTTRPRPSPISRRTFLGITGAAPFAVSTFGLAQSPKKIPVGLELYSVRTELMNDLMGTVRRVAKMGYEVVEFYAPYFQWTSEQAKDVGKLLADLGIKCNSTHNNAPSFTADGLQKAIDLNKAIGSKYIIMASPPSQMTTADNWKAFGQQLTAAAEKLKPLGMGTGYHNHATEWRLVEGKRPMDILAANTSRDVVLQFDVGTCVEAGADPVAWINANPGRIRSIHCKDWGAGASRGYNVAFGEGDSPWLKIFEAAEKTGGVEYYLIEQEQSPQGQQFQMAERCLANYKKLRG